MMGAEDGKVREWLRKQEALKIDPETAHVTWWWANEIDPFGDFPEMEEVCVNRGTFCRDPDSEVWVCFDDLSVETKDRLRERIARTPVPAHELAMEDLLSTVFDALDNAPADVAHLLLALMSRLLTAYYATDDASRKAAVVSAFKKRILKTLSSVRAPRLT